jgi:hypothetical protein
MATAIQLYDQPKSIATIGAQRTAIRELMQAHMKEGVHFLTIPGTDKPTLTKPGSELILSMFHIAAEPIVEDLSTPDEMRYRVFIQLTEMGTGRFLGKGVGEASSMETKYAWRKMVCQEEFDETPADRKRVIWKTGYGKNPSYRLSQVRTEMSDVANTILKMSKKRAQIDATLTATAASDLFMQDAQEVIDAGLDLSDEGGPATTETPRTTTLQPKQQAAPAAQGQQTPAPQQQAQTTPASNPATSGVRVISEQQGRLLYARGKGAGKQYSGIDAYLLSLGYSDKMQIPAAKFNDILAWAERP